MKGDNGMDGVGLESQAPWGLPRQQKLRAVPLTENVKSVLTKQADWQQKVEEVASRMAAAFAEEIQALVDPSINKSKLAVVKAVTDELESNLKDILLRQ